VGVTFAEQQGTEPCGMKGALRRMGIPLDGRHHRGIDDARNIAKLAQIILPALTRPADPAPDA
jgi:inhibitor of KinA sporulation pathway (predicted exonuclease)